MIALQNQARHWIASCALHWNSAVERLLQHSLAKDVVSALSGHRDRQLLVGLLSVFGLLIVWACFAPVDRIVRAEGQIGRAHV